MSIFFAVFVLLSQPEFQNESLRSIARYKGTVSSLEKMSPHKKC